MRARVTLLPLTLLLFSANFAVAQLTWEQYSLKYKLASEAYFYNAEFSHPVKPGYTLPGVWIKPLATLEVLSKVELTLGGYATLMQGTMSGFRYRPILTLNAYLFGDRGLYCALGTLPIEHPLPEWIYATQYAWLNNPEAGAMLRYDWHGARFQTWIDWDRFIWKDSNDEERFLFGAQVYALKKQDAPGIKYNAFFLARHHGGQIDTSHRPVVTSTNLGAELGYVWTLDERNFLLTRAAAVTSHDGHKPTPLTEHNGWAICPEFAWEWRSEKRYRVHCVVSYFYGQNFITLRGEELYRSYSLWSEEYVQPRRQFLKGSFAFQESFVDVAHFLFEANGYYDIDLRRIDYDFSLRLKLDLAWHW